jgi:hypothetical protein
VVPLLWCRRSGSEPRRRAAPEAAASAAAALRPTCPRAAGERAAPATVAAATARLSGGWYIVLVRDAAP